MSFLPEEIELQEFLSAVGGYDKREVREFLHAVAEELREKNARIQQLGEEIRSLRNESEATDAAGERELADALSSVTELVTRLRAEIVGAGSVAESLRDVQRGLHVVLEALERSTPDRVIHIPDAAAGQEEAQAVEPQESDESVKPGALPAIETPIHPNIDVEVVDLTSTGDPGTAPPPEWDELLADPDERLVRPPRTED